jgi:hypothetical protein
MAAREGGATDAERLSQAGNAGRRTRSPESADLESLGGAPDLDAREA